MYQIILASSSPRRREILTQVGIPFDVIPSMKEEVTMETEPEAIVKGLSMMKAEEVAAGILGQAIIIGADTVVALGGKILGKPKNEEEAYDMIRLLQNNEHEVYSGVTVMIKEASGQCEILTFAEAAKVTVAAMTKEEIIAYVDSNEPMGKAGAYAIQGRFATYVTKITGDYYTIVGLPIARLYQEVLTRGIDLRTCNRKK